ncbi:MAG: hypothetical protein E3J47_05870 [Candidatus Stahlbacteria bacterium]|nr:MAG: hypothetical protein E3J47_05870 [Candidatus Stahlbacteria bacterium]
MAGIIEIWRKGYNLSLPVKFTVDQQPTLEDGTVVEDSPAVSKIDYRETGSLAGKRMTEPVFCISFDESPVQRFIKVADVVDIAYELAKPQEIKTPDLEE